MENNEKQKPNDKRVLITGTSSGIGYHTALMFLQMGFEVVGIDILEPKINNEKYKHFVVDVSIKKNLPEFPYDFNYIVNNAGVVDERKIINVNLVGYINIAEKYAYTKSLKSLVNVASNSVHTGIERLRNTASQGGRVAITKHLAMELGRKYKARVNSISPGAVSTNLEPELYKNKELVDAKANKNLFKRWIDPKEIANWIYFVSVVNKSLTGQDIAIDCGESINFKQVLKV